MISPISSSRFDPRFASKAGSSIRSGSSPPPALAGITFETPFGEPGQVSVQATKGATLTFSTVAAGGQYIARPYESSGWFVQSVTLGGKDITDRAFDLQADATSLVVTYTDRPSKVSGTVADERGAASATAVVLVFPVDPRKWSGYGASPRTLKSALTTRSGVYTFDHLPPGDYYAIAIEAADMDGWSDPATLEALASSGDEVDRRGRRYAEDRSILRVKAISMIGRSRWLLIIGIACGAAAAAQTPVRDNARVARRHRDRSRALCSPLPATPRQPARRVRVTLTNVARTLAGSDHDHRRQRRIRLSRSAGRPVRAAGVQERLSQSQLRRVAAGPRRHARCRERRRAVANLAMTIARGGVITGVVRDTARPACAGRERAGAEASATTR